MIMTVQDIARVCHQTNKAFCEAMGDESHKDWEDAPIWQRDSACIGVAAHIDSGLTMLPEDSHISWMKQKESEGWVYGEVKDAEKKTHPCMRPYSELPIEQRTKDFLFREVVHAMVKMNDNLISRPPRPPKQKMEQPTIGRIVHYHRHGSPDGTHKAEPSPAVITAVWDDVGTCQLFVMNPNGLYFNTTKYSEEPKPGHWSWPPRV